MIPVEFSSMAFKCGNCREQAPNVKFIPPGARRGEGKGCGSKRLKTFMKTKKEQNMENYFISDGCGALARGEQMRYIAIHKVCFASVARIT
jgi:hypothetical protein